MHEIHNDIIAATPVQSSVLKLIYDRYAEETVTDEEVRRVFEPIGNMIKAGRFESSRRPVTSAKYMRHLAAAAAMIAVAVGLGGFWPVNKDQALTVIPDTFLQK